MLTGNALLTGLSRYIGDLEFPEGLTTTGGGSTTTLVDSALERYGDDYLRDWYIRITEAVAGNQYVARRINDSVESSGTCTVAPAFPGATGSGTDYELHRHSPAEKFAALDEARIGAYPALGLLVIDDTLTGDGVQSTFDIPASIRRGPIDAYMEVPVAVGQNWNFGGDPFGQDTTKFTTSNCTASLKDYDATDYVMPKYGDGSATRLTVAASTAATYTQVVASMANSITAAAAAGRRMAHAKWFYASVADVVRLGITDDAGTTYGDYHKGHGWELLTAERIIAGNNATILSTVIDMAATTYAQAYFWQHEWFYYGAAEKVTESWEPIPLGEPNRDNIVQQVTFPGPVPRGRQIRLVGRSPLSALGTDAISQATNEMEVDEAEAEILYAEAAKVLFRRGILSSSAMAELAGPMQLNEAQLSELKSKWAQQSPGPRMKSMYG